MKTTLIRFGIGAVLLGAASSTHALLFNDPPEDNHPDWETVFPYQRNIFIGFDTDPHDWPRGDGEPAGSVDLTQDTVHHEGWDDPELYPSDWLDGSVTGNGYTDWVDTDPSHTNRQGLLKLAVDAGEGGSTITLVWHIDNWNRLSDSKHFFVEAEYYTTGNTGVDELFSSVASSLPVTLTPHTTSLSGGWTRWWAEGTLLPNPEWEEMRNTVTFEGSATQDSYLLLDYMHIATECVPEPGSLWLLALGGAAVLMRRRR